MSFHRLRKFVKFGKSKDSWRRTAIARPHCGGADVLGRADEADEEAARPPDDSPLHSSQPRRPVHSSQFIEPYGKP